MQLGLIRKEFVLSLFVGFLYWIFYIFTWSNSASGIDFIDEIKQNNASKIKECLILFVVIKYFLKYLFWVFISI